MAVFAKLENPSRSNTQERMINEALGTKDNYGNPFFLFKIQATRSMPSYVSTHGYEDTMVYKSRKGDLVVKHRPGRLKWMRDGLSSKPTAILAKTPKNLRMLASEYRDGTFIIKDPLIDAEVKRMSDQRVAAMTPDERKADDHRIKMMHESRFGGRMQVRGKSAQVENLEDREKSLNKRQAELDRREAELASRQGSIIKDIHEGKAPGMLTEYSDEALEVMHTSVLKKVATQMYGVKGTLQMTKKQTLDAIKAAKANLKKKETQKESGAPDEDVIG